MSSVAIPFGDNAFIIGTSVDSSVNRFTGIPFAQPPVGDNRWKQPVKLPAGYFQSNSPYDATKFKDLCLQPPSPLPHDPSQHATYSEDCLYVNVWTPAGEPPEGGWPVIIWIHGGWLQLGDPMFDQNMHPWELISKDGYGLDVVVVAPGYRLNIFGFLGADVDGELPGNWGFWDQRCAIEWISENVKYFGGNNQNVTLGGVSAGAYSTQVNLFYELFQAADKGAKPLFQRVWMSSNAMPTDPKTLQEATGQFNDLCTAFKIPLSTKTSEKLSRLRVIPGEEILSTIRTLPNPTFRATLDDIFISRDTFKNIHSGELARRFHERGMKLLIGEVEHEEVMYAIGAPTTQEGLLPGLQNYYRNSVAEALITHYTDRIAKSVKSVIPAKRKADSPESKGNGSNGTTTEDSTESDVVSMYTGIVTDVQVRATTRNFAKALVDGGVPICNIYRYRISLPIKGEDAKLLGPHAERFKGKVVHAFDFLHWWYTKRVGFTPEEDSAIREWLKPFAQFVKGEEVNWGTEDIAQFRHLTEDAKVKVVQDSYWSNLMDTAAVLRKMIEQEGGGAMEALKEATVGK